MRTAVVGGVFLHGVSPHRSALHAQRPEILCLYGVEIGALVEEGLEFVDGFRFAGVFGEQEPPVAVHVVEILVEPARIILRREVFGIAPVVLWHEILPRIVAAGHGFGLRGEGAIENIRVAVAVTVPVVAPDDGLLRSGLPDDVVHAVDIIPDEFLTENRIRSVVVLLPVAGRPGLEIGVGGGVGLYVRIAEGFGFVDQLPQGDVFLGRIGRSRIVVFAREQLADVVFRFPDDLLVVYPLLAGGGHEYRIGHVAAAHVVDKGQRNVNTPFGSFGDHVVQHVQVGRFDQVALRIGEIGGCQVAADDRNLEFGHLFEVVVGHAPQRLGRLGYPVPLEAVVVFPAQAGLEVDAP